MQPVKSICGGLNTQHAVEYASCIGECNSWRNQFALALRWVPFSISYTGSIFRLDGPLDEKHDKKGGEVLPYIFRNTKTY